MYISGHIYSHTTTMWFWFFKGANQASCCISEGLCLRPFSQPEYQFVLLNIYFIPIISHWEVSLYASGSLTTKAWRFSSSPCSLELESAFEILGKNADWNFKCFGESRMGENVLENIFGEHFTWFWLGPIKEKRKKGKEWIKERKKKWGENITWFWLGPSPWHKAWAGEDRLDRAKPPDDDEDGDNDGDDIEAGWIEQHNLMVIVVMMSRIVEMMRKMMLMKEQEEEN